ncbi:MULTISPECIES: hypothetical protein [Thermomonosporaceae]|uniref:hypothetical protein n=1 Tax=Thermomonosporaceae TaxID=2012 RepID=UPI00255B04DF|nr:MULTISPECIES: hypothetical protein [Thermomonosporaceae]MDL4773924.1 hypothetical protein [Actinomadura xylanilytica]
MINWRPAIEGFDPTFPAPLDAIDPGLLGGGLAAEAREDFEIALRGSLQDVESKLAMGPGAHMMNATGSLTGMDGTRELLSDHEVDYAYDDAAVETALAGMSRKVAGRAAELRFASFTYYVRMGEPGSPGPQRITIRRSTEWQNKDAPKPAGTLEAVCVDMEHRSGVALAVFMPYDHRVGRLHLGDLVGGPSHRRFWG